MTDIISEDWPGLTMRPEYEDGTWGIRCRRCGVEFVGIHCCEVK